jgi:hypothetical protein
LLTLYHSTITVPLNRFGDAGRRTTMRVRYGWPELTGVAVVVPSAA